MIITTTGPPGLLVPADDTLLSSFGQPIRTCARHSSKLISRSQTHALVTIIVSVHGAMILIHHQAIQQLLEGAGVDPDVVRQHIGDISR